MNQRVAEWSEWIDLEQMHLLSNGDSTFVKTMLEIYMEDFSRYLLMLKAAVAKRDFEEVRYIGHKMKSPASTVRVKGIRDMLDFFESAEPIMEKLLQVNLDKLSEIHSNIIVDLKKELQRIGQTS